MGISVTHAKRNNFSERERERKSSSPLLVVYGNWPIIGKVLSSTEKTTLA